MIDPDAKVGLFTRFWDWLTYRPWTDEQIAERVARSVANTRHESWHPPEEHAGPPVTGRLRHSFTELTDEEIAERGAIETPPPPRRTKRFIYGDNWNAYQRLVEKETP